MNAVTLINHIAWRFLNDEDLIWEIMELVHPNVYQLRKDQEIPDDIQATYNLLSTKENTSFYVTNTVLDKLDLLKVNRNDKGWYDYTIFKHLSRRKCTYIFPDNKLVRMVITESQIVFDYIRFERNKGNKLEGHMNNCLYYVDKITGEPCSHYGHSDVKEIEDRLYKLLCFMYLSDITEVILQPGQSLGTRKTGKIVNELKTPITVVNSNWNITSIRTEGFMVSGHLRLQPYGTNRERVRVQWIDPFEKNGYVRKAKSQN